LQLSSQPTDPENPEYQALASLMRGAGLEPTSLNLLRALCPTPEDASKLVKWMALSPAEPGPDGEAGSSFRRLAANVDESGFSLGAWVAALLAVHDWLEQRQLRATFADVAEYVRCCATAATPGGAAPLTDLRSNVLEMLRLYGIDAATPIP
jgi:hypothetical protein